jgi:tetratricopeptide (TPR) repeat protein
LVQSVRATRAQKVAEEQRDKAQRTLEQLSASAKARVMGFVERAETQASRQEEINNIARSDASALSDLERATQLNKLSGQYFENGDFVAARKAAENATRLVGTTNTASQTATTRLTNADAYQRSALAKAHLGRFDEAKKDQATSLELIQSVSGGLPGDADLRERLAAALVNMGEICMEANEFEEAFPTPSNFVWRRPTCEPCQKPKDCWQRPTTDWCVFTTPRPEPDLGPRA